MPAPAGPRLLERPLRAAAPFLREQLGRLELPANHLFATLVGQQNALVLETDLLGEFSVVQLGGGLTQTAYALVADMVALARRG